MDAFGVRPAMETIAERIAADGYAVLVPDLFYRGGRFGPFDAKTGFKEPETAALIRAAMGATTQAMTQADTAFFLDALAAHGVTGPIGTTGYCMGGPRAINAAAAHPDRIVAAASFHGGNLANDAPDSPQMNAPRIKARVYVASPASTAVSRRSSRQNSRKHFAPPRSTTPSRTMSAWRMAGACRTTPSSTSRAPSAILPA